jgi:pimeloyl-ACP methyl ester carboxylesterase
MAIGIQRKEASMRGAAAMIAVATLLVLWTLALAGGVLAAVVLGGPGNDKLRGTPRADRLYGKGGNDRIFGLGGNDLLVGGVGNDSLTGGGGADRLSCGPGRDIANADAKDVLARGCETVRGIPKPPAPPEPAPWTGSRKVDVGGYALFIRCSGARRPTVVVDNGRGQTADRWDQVQPLVAANAHICVYDRAGLAQSDPRPSGVYPDNIRMVEELRTLLRNAELAPPYVLAAWSFGGINAHYYAYRYPIEVAGAVLLDAPWAPARAAAGCRRLDDPLEPADCTAAGQQLASAGSVFAAKPLVVLENALDTDAEWQEYQRRLASLSSHVRHARADGSDHFGFLSTQANLTAEAIKQVADAVREQRMLPPCASVFPPLGATCLG